ncbi:hypothetical protein [Sinorhizobium terangae]|uniref:hypothetical protein n=1 Tax=Sinorhizobium terangae TaxID=110322 RepID=UPI0024B12376|nr:hypothetical protein [Sinorhizobium terangae]WFU49135.1 hypothetical protein QA637_06980 [Sinorhizobium terangae]
MSDKLDPIATAGMSRSNLIDIRDRLSEAEDFCRAIFMAAAGLHDRDSTAVFQSLADIAKFKIRGAITELSEFREDVQTTSAQA